VLLAQSVLQYARLSTITSALDRALEATQTWLEAQDPRVLFGALAVILLVAAVRAFRVRVR
jgi:hypothetical protein